MTSAAGGNTFLLLLVVSGCMEVACSLGGRHHKWLIPHCLGCPLYAVVTGNGYLCLCWFGIHNGADVISDTQHI